jgi:hypothetical protein
MWEIDRMLLRGVINLDEHATLEQFCTDLHVTHSFGIPPQSMEVKSHSSIPSSGTQREAFAIKKLSRARKKLKACSPEVDKEIMDLGLDVARRYDPWLVKIGVECLHDFYAEWG